MVMKRRPSSPCADFQAFPGVVALDDISLEVGRGEVVALSARMCAGKSTLMKILGGVYQPDAGEILLDDQPPR